MITHDIERTAKEAAGNWERFDSFGWNRQYDLDRPEDWTIVYSSNRDSGLLDQSNAAAIDKAMEPFTEGDDPDAVSESHSHWAVGYVDGYSIRVYREGEITEAFRTYFEIMESLANYPVLDEEDYSEREYEATLENISQAAWGIRDEYELPDGWEPEAFSWFWDNDQSAVENRDDQGGYPSEDELRAAFDGLGYKRTDQHRDYEDESDG